jgi:hypothetical protein
MMRFLQHPEARRLLRDAAWLAALLALLWSPLPEMLLGRWLQVGNDARPETGRAHDRVDLLQESDSQTVARSGALAKEKEESARVVTLGQLRVYLLRHAELDMGLAAFREFYASLSTWQQDQLVSPDELSEIARRGLAEVNVSRADARARFVFLDGSHDRLAQAEADLLQLQMLPLGLSQVAPPDTAQALAGATVSEVVDAGGEAQLLPAHRELLKRLRLLPGLSVRRVWQAEGAILLIEISASGARQWLRPAATELGLAPDPRREGRA